MPSDEIKLDAADDSDFEAYRHLLSRAGETSRTGGRFQARVKVFRVPRMVIIERHVGGVVHKRDRTRVSRDGFDHITLHIPIAGDLVAGPVGEERRLQSGEILVLDTSRPHVSQCEDTRLFSVQLARAHVQAVLGDVDSLHGSVLSEAAGGMLADFVASFARRIDTLPSDTMGHLARATIELFGLGVRDLQVSARALSAVSGDTLRRTRAEAFITAHLADPGLNADAVAIGIGTSRTILYRLFSDEGGVKQFIQQQRLDGLRRALLEPGEERRLGCLAQTYGFASQSHCNRLFAATFGLPPGQFRTKFGRAHTRDTYSGPDERIVRWTSELY